MNDFRISMLLFALFLGACFIFANCSHREHATEEVRIDCCKADFAKDIPIWKKEI